MLIATGIALVLVSWAFAALVVAALGALPAVMVSLRTGAPLHAGRVARQSLWWGVLVGAIATYLLNLALPLHAIWAGVCLLLLAGASAIGAWCVGRRTGWLRRSVELSRARILMLAALAGGVCYFALAALGPVTNYDSGLYHLGAVSYAGDYPAIPGIANLYFALGYGNAEFPLAAILGNGPWQGDGFRLLNGLVMALAALDLALRLRSRRPTAGMYVLLAGLVAAWVPMLALSDYWVTSPSQDSAVFIVTVVATAYLADALTSKAWVSGFATALGLSLLLVLLRPTMLVFALAVAAIAIVMWWRRRRALRGQKWGSAAWTLVVAAAIAGIAATARDYVLSGWLQFPLSVLPFDVAWRAEDPSMYRDATLGFHRNPADLWGSVTGYAWLGPWLSDRVRQWETYEFLALVLAAIAALVLAAARGAGVRWKAMAIAMLPSIAATAFWFIATPPSYRFAWGPLFTIATVPLGFALYAWAKSGVAGRPRDATALVLAAVAILGVVGFSAIARFDWASVSTERDWHLGISVPYAVTPVVDVPVRNEQAQSGLELLVPTQSDQCWANYPLCTPTPNPGLSLRGADIASGFLP